MMDGKSHGCRSIMGFVGEYAKLTQTQPPLELCEWTGFYFTATPEFIKTGWQFIKATPPVHKDDIINH